MCHLQSRQCQLSNLIGLSERHSGGSETIDRILVSDPIATLQDDDGC